MDRKNRENTFHICFPMTKNAFYKCVKSAPGYLVTFVEVSVLFLM